MKVLKHALIMRARILAKSLEDPADQRSFPAALAILNMAGCFKPLPLSYYSPNPPPALPPPEPHWPEPDLEPKVG